MSTEQTELIKTLRACGAQEADLAADYIEALQAENARLTAHDQMLVDVNKELLDDCKHLIAERDALQAKLKALEGQEAVAWGMPDAEQNIVDTITEFDRTGEMKKWEAQYSIPLYLAAGATPASAAVPKGWKLVPIEPTEEMLSAAINISCLHLNGSWSNTECQTDRERADKSNREYYAALLSAAPQPPTSAKPLTDEQTYTAYQLSLCELERLVNNNFGRMPQGVWSDKVLSVRDALEAQGIKKEAK